MEEVGRNHTAIETPIAEPTCGTLGTGASSSIASDFIVVWNPADVGVTGGRGERISASGEAVVVIDNTCCCASSDSFRLWLREDPEELDFFDLLARGRDGRSSPSEPVLRRLR